MPLEACQGAYLGHDKAVGIDLLERVRFPGNDRPLQRLHALCRRDSDRESFLVSLD